MNISLLPGWGLGLAPLQPLADSLAHCGEHHACAKGLAPEKVPTTSREQAPSYREILSNKHEVQLLPIPECTSLEQALNELDAQIPADSWLIGWSLGGMLATALAHRRGNSCPGLITLASNACFVARDDWPHAMPEREFKNFSRLVARDWTSTLKGFQQLCMHGSETQTVPAEMSASVSADVEASLSWLAQLDNRAAIAELQCRQLHVLATADALVPATVAQDLQRLNPQVQVHSWPGSHAFVLVDHSELATVVDAFMRADVAND